MSGPQASVHDEGVENLSEITTVHAFDTNYFVENLAVRSSGQILVTVHNTNELIEIDPNDKTKSGVVHRFSHNLFGIVEVQPDKFYVSSGTIGDQGSFAVYTVDLSKAGSSPAVSKLVDVPDAIFLNGSALLDRAKGIFLVADSILGAVFAIDSTKGTVTKWLQHPSLAKATNEPNIPGLNGIKIFKNHLYLSNTDAKTFLRVALTSTGSPDGEPEIVFKKCNIDDFAFDEEGGVYVATHLFNSVVRVLSDGKRNRIAGGPDDTTVAGTTAVAFGRRAGKDSKTIYVTTNGGMSSPVHGKVGPARLLAIQVDEAGYSQG